MLTVENVRLYAKDKAEFNVLLEGEPQSSNELIELAIHLAVDSFNNAAPLTSFTWETFPSDEALFYGVMHHLANSEAERQLRNQVTYNAQGLNAGIDDKFMQYNTLAQYYKGLFEQRIAALKTYMNQNAAWGGSWSPYAAINEFRFRG